MKTSTLTWRSLRHHGRNSVSVFIGVVIAVAVLVGAMLVGDSVRYTLRRLALQRLGGIHFALQTRGRFFSAELAEALTRKTDVVVAPVLQARGVMIGGAGRVNNVQVLGVDGSFWPLGGELTAGPGPDGVALNVKLAQRLGVVVGDEVSLRMPVPALLSRDAPLAAGAEARSVRSRLVVKSIVPDDQLGRFSLAAEQIAPYNAFVELPWMQARLEQGAVANMLVVGQSAHGQLSVAYLQGALADVWQLEYAGMRIRAVPAAGLAQLEGKRIFLDQAVSAVALRAEGAVGTFTYLVQSISKTTAGVTRSTPYSFVSACSPSDKRTLSPVALRMHDDEIVLNRWLAEQLDAWPGDNVTVTYSQLLASNDYTPVSARFRVARIAGMEDVAMERELMPTFPGLSDVESCAGWDIGMPLDEKLLQDKPNEAYWEQYRATPKAFVTLAAGQAMWSSRFGDVMTVRFAVDGYSVEEVRNIVSVGVDPAGLGFVFLPVRDEALQAVDKSLDFGGLFIGMSFFLIVAALLLTGLLFVFGLQGRAGEMGVLLAMGYPVARVRAMFLKEGALISLAGAVGGAGVAALYTRVLVWGLGTYWRGAVAGAAILYHGQVRTVVLGALAGFVCAMAAIAGAMWRLCSRPVSALLAGDSTQSAPPSPPPWHTARQHGAAGRRALQPDARGNVVTSLRKAPDADVAPLGRRGRSFSPWWPASLLAALAGIGLAVVFATGDAQGAVMGFFSAGSLMLLAGICVCRWLLGGVAGRVFRRLTVNTLGLRNTMRRAGRSVTVVALLACGCFMVLAVSSMQEDVGRDAERRASGSGGFAYFARTALPVRENLGRAAGRKAFGLDRDAALAGVEAVSLKTYEGDDASCFNLNRAGTPGLFGVDPEEFIRRGAFVKEGKASPWSLLMQELPDGAVPALAGDADTAAWGLAAKVGPDGDVLVYRDERGELFNVKLVGKLPMRISVFQGALLISDEAFTRRFPSIEGYNAFLFDAPAAGAALREALESRFERQGMDVTATAERLREFYSVQSAYLRMFLVLGGLALLLGSAGMGIVVMRNVMERRAELAILRAVGYSRAKLRRMVIVEHVALLLLGLLIGAVSALVAMWPSFGASGVHVPYGLMLLILGGVLVFGLACTAAAATLATRGDLVPALRSE